MRALTLFFILLLSACAPHGKSSRKGPAPFVSAEPVTAPAPKPSVTFVTEEWTPSNVEVLCGADRCPIQVGALIFAGSPVNGKVPLSLCTSFLVAQDVIMSNAHCGDPQSRRGWFVSQKINGAKEVREVIGIPYRRFTPHPKGEQFTSGRPDAALFTLKSKVAVPPLKLASGPQIDFTKLTAFAILNSEESKLTIGKVECQVRRHEAEFPVELRESPDVIRSFGCDLRPGTSGAPMFAPGLEEVQALHFGGMNPLRREKLANRPLQIFEKQWTSNAVNLRCLDLPGRSPVSCLAVTEALVTERFRDRQYLEQDRLAERDLSNQDSPVRLKAIPYLLSPPNEMRFEVIHIPKCRREGAILSKFSFVIEQVKIRFDEWAAPTTESLSKTEVTATAEVAGNNVFKIQLSWPTAAGPYAEPDLDLRKKWGSTFHIEIPPCPR